MANPPSGDSPEGRQPEVPEPAKVERGLLMFHNHSFLASQDAPEVMRVTY